MDWAERAYRQIFPSSQADRELPPYVYRYYPETGNYLGIADGRAFVLGPVSNGQILEVGRLEDFACLVYPGTCSGATAAWLAGTGGGCGRHDARGSRARLCFPTGLAVDVDGNTYVADQHHSVIRRVTADGRATTFSGVPNERSGPAQDGPAHRAVYWLPAGLALDSSRELWVADSGTHRIRRIAADGSVTTIAGVAGPGSTDGPAASARFNMPQGIAFDPSGNLWVADSGNHTIRRISRLGEVTTIAGSPGAPGSVNGRGNAARFTSPYFIAIDQNGNAFVTEVGRYAIRRIDPDGNVSTFAGQLDALGTEDGVGTAARFIAPSGLAFDRRDGLLVADGSRLRRVSRSGAVTTVAGSLLDLSNTDGPLHTARFGQLRGIAADGYDNVLLADHANHTLRRIGPDQSVSTLAGSPRATANANGRGAAAKLVDPGHPAVDAAGNLFVPVQGSTVRRITPGGEVTIAGTIDNPPGGWPRGAAMDSTGRLFVADPLRFAIYRIEADGRATVHAGRAGSGGSSDGPASTARLFGPKAMARDRDDNLVFTDGHAIRRVSPTGTVTTVAGSTGQTGGQDGIGTGARFNTPNGIAIDASGNVYVADTSNCVIRKLAPDGRVTTLAGPPPQQILLPSSRCGHADGAGSAARFDFPEGIAVGSDGNLYVADTRSGVIRRVTPDGRVTTVLGVPYELVLRTDEEPRLNRPTGIVAVGEGRYAIVDAHEGAVVVVRLH